MSAKRSWYVIAHEIYHLWNGIAIAAQDGEDTYWFAEGFTSYGAFLETHRSGLMDRDEFLSEIAGAYDRYIAGMRKADGKVSLRQAGRDKPRHYDIIYDGGMLIALVLDIEARSRPAGKDFSALMRLAYDRYGRTGVGYSHDDLRGLANDSVGADMAEFFSRYVEGTEEIPLAVYLGKAGLRLTSENGNTIILPDPAASEVQRQILQIRPRLPLSYEGAAM